jgi:hypothetical protein
MHVYMPVPWQLVGFTGASMARDPFWYRCSIQGPQYTPDGETRLAPFTLREVWLA